MRYHSSHHRGFSLVEILVVLAIMSVLMGIGVMSFKNQGGQEFTKSVSELSGTLELCQAHAVANRTTVRIFLGDDEGTLVVLPLSFSLGGTPSEEESNNFHDFNLWTPVTKTVSLRNTSLNDEFVPFNEDLKLLSENTITPFTHRVAGREITFTSIIQFSPNGEVTLDSAGKAVRGIQWGVQSRGGKVSKAIFQVSGLTGRVQVYREEDFEKLTQ